MKKCFFLAFISMLLLPKIALAVTSYDESTWCNDPVKEYNAETGELSCTYSFKIDNTDATKFQSYIEHMVVNLDIEGLTLKEVKPLNGWSEYKRNENTGHTLSIQFVSSTKRNENPNIIHTTGTHEIAEFIFTATGNPEDIKATASIGNNGYFNDEVRKCKIIDDDIYFNSSSLIVTKDNYLKSCNPDYVDEEKVESPKESYKCKEVNNKYYDSNGNVVSKEAYNKSCNVVENPKTGNYLPYIILTLFVAIGITLLVINKKNNLFKKI